MSKEIWAVWGAVAAIGGPLIFNMFKEMYFDRKKRETERNYILVQLIFILDKFTAACARVAWDDGYPPDEPPSEIRVIQVSDPVFDLSSVKGEYKYLSPEQLYRLQAIDIKLIQIKEKLRSYEMLDYPASDRYFASRRRLYIELGLYTDSLIQEIRHQSNIKHNAWNNEVSPVDSIKNSQLQLNKMRSVRTLKQMERKAKNAMKSPF
ncbi:TPA: hypothetical protein ACVBYD_004103 [Yersinia enterocolitica]|uniref:hypothetical protein n=1 Tax=Yersinia TaxID=629 RepID=UPI0005FCDF41|nr:MULTISPECIES: hypothetical protein [Yersinia]AKF40329.1 hypothetical protein FORC2_p051 [Yersinia enterocolitica]EKN3829035.1 hypothetical protein [Yersinia enterocolitica]EKN3882898.1 hypothetical protein [Yersinia enterocolitica]EKN4012431.1 hypothetical protein [Yersinia enterocolitica]EKN4827747.1 hypothetical protein [Yersinia enterocolitica]